MKKKYWFILLIIIIIIGGIFFYKNSVKNYKSGNNKNSQEIVNYILNISSYEVKVTVDVSSNKNSNKYKVRIHNRSISRYSIFTGYFHKLQIIKRIYN